MYPVPDAILTKIPCMQSKELKLALNISQHNVQVAIHFRVNTKFDISCDMANPKKIRNCTSTFVSQYAL